MNDRFAKLFSFLLLTLWILPLTSTVHGAAQTSDIIREAGDIAGTVTYCGQTAPDMTVYIRGTSYSSTTDADGNFKLSYLQQGTYDLVIKDNESTLGTIPQITVIKKVLTTIGTNDFCLDMDGDGFNPPADCNDNNPNINPDAVEICDGVDNNCNGSIDEGCSICTDNDKDSFFAQANCGTPMDCDDSSSIINPQATEVCDGVDNNCNTQIDETGAVGETTYYRDVDLDGFGDNNDTLQACGAPAGYVISGGDCDDNDPSTNPNATEIADGIDNNCDGQIDEGITPPGQITINSSTIFTVPAGITQIQVELWGAGGGGGGSEGTSFLCINGAGGGGGGGGGYSSNSYVVSSGEVIPVSIGSGGNSGAAGANGINGTDTSFSDLLMANGGQGGKGASNCNAGTGGFGGFGDPDIGDNGIPGNGCEGGLGGQAHTKGGNGGSGCSSSSEPGQGGLAGHAVISW